MAVKWKSSGTKGIRYYEHPTRTWKRGVIKYRDRYYAIRYSVDGKQVEEGIGWDSEFADAKEKALAEAGDDKGKKAMTKAMSSDAEEEAERRIAELKENRRRGEGPRTLAEKRGLDDADRQEKAEQKEQAAKDGLTFAELFEGQYTLSSKPHKAAKTWEREEGLYTKWIKPSIGGKALPGISPFDIEKIKAAMTANSAAPFSIGRSLGVVRAVFNWAAKRDLYDKANPVSKVRIPRGDNRRMRFLSHDEAGALLAELAKTSLTVHDAALISLHCGLRAGEIFNLHWGDIDLDRGVMIIKDTKSGRNRHAYMTEGVRAMLKQRERGLPSELVFKDRWHGGRIQKISRTFTKAVNKLKLNAGVVDRRQKICFHSCRHTFASWHAEASTDLFTIKELLGHHDIRMTTRYSHLGENTLQAATRRLDSTLQTPGKVIALAKKEG